MHTIGTELKVSALRGTPPVLQTAGRCGRKEVRLGFRFRLPDIYGCSKIKPEVAASGFPHLSSFSDYKNAGEGTRILFRSSPAVIVPNW
jgi:hypothetical protein